MAQLPALFVMNPSLEADVDPLSLLWIKFSHSLFVGQGRESILLIPCCQFFDARAMLMRYFVCVCVLKCSFGDVVGNLALSRYHWLGSMFRIAHHKLFLGKWFVKAIAHLISEEYVL